MSTVVIESRYNGPAGTGNGGWSAGTIAALVDRPGGTVVTLLAPPPLATPLSVVRDADRVSVVGPDGVTVGEGAPAHVDTEPVPPVDFATAVEASKDYSGLADHPFPTCFVCGPQRAIGDGLRLFPGRLGSGRTAAPWRVPDDVTQTMVWAALDCPGGWTVGVEARPYVLGRIAVRLDGVPAPGDECVVMGQLLSSEGRKALVATTLYSPTGEPLARSRATWIAIA
ncbi:MAG TPA: hypothetical protein VKB59_12260 [Micromonosporaceae bacterium]|nr:hypothetical protein [Micromonosporaceae bacterium]